MKTRNIPKVSLINYTKDPITTMCFARRIMHNPVPDSLVELKKEPKKWLGYELDEYVKQVLLPDGMPTFLEYINFTFKIENVSRAFTHQLVRHRLFSFSQQSLRCVDLPNFADDMHYYNPYTTADEANRYHFFMLEIQDAYRAALKAGTNTQDARGLLPMNIHTSITFHCNLRSLIDMVNKRLCYKTQEEFGMVAQDIIKLVKEIDNRLALWFKRPCDKGYCMMQGENEEQFAAGKLTGKQNTDHCCLIFLEKFKNIKSEKKIESEKNIRNSFDGVDLQNGNSTIN